MNMAILKFTDGTTQSIQFSGNPNSIVDYDNRLFLPTNKRYDSIMGGWWLTYQELEETK